MRASRQTRYGALLAAALLAACGAGCQEEPSTRVPATRPVDAALSGPRARPSTRPTATPLSESMRQIAACKPWSPVNGLSPNHCPALRTLLTTVLRGQPPQREQRRRQLVPYLASPSAPVRYAAAYALCQPTAPIIRQPAHGVAILDALTKEPAPSIITWLGQAVGGVDWQATGLGARIRRLATRHPKRNLRYALLSSLSGGRTTLSDPTYDFLVDRARRDPDPHARILAMGTLGAARTRRATTCPLWVELARDRRHPKVAGQAAVRLTYWKGQLSGRYQALCADQHGTLLGEILRRLRADPGITYSHFLALDRLCDPRHAAASVNQRCWRGVRAQLGRSRHRARLITLLGDRDPRGASAARPYLRHRDPAVRRAARRALHPKLVLAETFVHALAAGRVMRAHHLVGRDRWRQVPRKTMQRWVRLHRRLTKTSPGARLRVELLSRRDGQSTACWRRRFPGTKRSGACRKWTTRWTELRFRLTAGPHHTFRPLVAVRVADYHHQPPHPDPLTNRTYRAGKRYHVVSWRPLPRGTR